MVKAMSGTLDAVDEAAPMESFSTAAFATHEPYPLPSEHMFRYGSTPCLAQQSSQAALFSHGKELKGTVWHAASASLASTLVTGLYITGVLP